MPFVRLKIAASLDGTTALPNGVSQWITSDAARRDGHLWRAQADAILTGIGTVLADDPRLDVRTQPVPARQPAVVVIDSDLRTPENASIFIASRQVYICANSQNDAKARRLQASGAILLHAPGAAGQVDLADAIRQLDAAGIRNVHVEAGAVLNGALVRAGLVDEYVIFLAPQFLGAGRGMAQLGMLTSLGDAPQLEFISTTMVGSDLRIIARPRGPAR